MISDKGARGVALGLFIILTVGTPLGVLRCIELLVTTNQLIYLLLTVVGAYLAVLFAQCLVRFINSFD